MLKRRWKRNLLGIDELPAAIRDSPLYAEADFWVDRIRETDDDLFIGIWFDDGSSDLWRKDASGWRRHLHCDAKK